MYFTKIKKTSLLLSLLLTVSLSSLAQEKCLTELIYNKLSTENKSSFTHAEEKAAQFKGSKNNFKSGPGTLLTIPVVVHVIYNPLMPESNLSETTIQSQIDVLNEDFRRRNLDRKNTRPIFDSIAADFQVEFVLATKDPNNQPSNGITRTSSLLNYNPLLVENFVKQDMFGGHDAWPANEYLNIWTCDMSLIASQFVIGYAQFPGGDPSTDGVVIQWQFFGRTSTDNKAVGSLGRTTTHEVGHWLGLRHIWGDGNCANDFVDDTPNASASSTGCGQDKNTCSNESGYWQGINPPDMTENYMDYGSDACFNAFTAGQKERILSFLYTDTLRKALFSSDKGMAITGVYTQQLPKHTLSQNFSDKTITIQSEALPKALFLLDMSGKELKQVSNTNLLSYAGLPVGIYILRMEWENQVIVNSKIALVNGY